MTAAPAKSVEAYLEALPEDRRAVIARMREIALRTLPGFSEGMEYGIPYYRRGPHDAIGFSSRAQYVAIYAGENVLSAHRRPLEGHDAGNGCVRFARIDAIDWALVESLFRTASA